MFEVLATDLAGRIGKLRTKHGVIDTPAILPVVHPVRRDIPTAKIRILGFQAVMTNAYLTMKKYGEEAVKRGIHTILGFDGVVMTDSGGYQVLEYGALDITPTEIAKYEEAIGSDIAITLDRPTGMKATKEYAEKTVDETYHAARESMKSVSRRDTLWSGPIQGGIHYPLVEKSARMITRLEFDLYALGSPTEIMETYEFSLLAGMIVAAKINLPLEAPLHLFGAGHPLTMALATALGCDLFDSASYILYARGDRYMTDYGTTRLQELSYFACSCEICTSYTPAEVRELTREKRTNALALHNLHVLSKEMRGVRQAVEEGRLWEYVGIKARAHPSLWKAYRSIEKKVDFLEDGTPLFKDRAIFLSSPPDHNRPEVVRCADSIATNIKLGKKKSLLLVLPETSVTPFYNSRTYRMLTERLGSKLDRIQVAFLAAPFGLIPVEISDVYPFSQYVSSLDPAGTVEQITIERVIKCVKSWRPKSIMFLDDAGRYSKLMNKLANKIKSSKITSGADLQKAISNLNEKLP